MAKKKFNISSTLQKNQESKLAEKIPLRKTAKDIEEVKEKVEQITPKATEKAKPVESKTTSPATKSAKKVVEKEKLVRMTIDTPEHIHKKLKIRSVEKGISLRDYILRLIEKELK